MRNRGWTSLLHGRSKAKKIKFKRDLPLSGRKNKEARVKRSLFPILISLVFVLTVSSPAAQKVPIALQ